MKSNICNKTKTSVMVFNSPNAASQSARNSGTMNLEWWFGVLKQQLKLRQTLKDKKNYILVNKYK